jgi:hypothetical protein
MGGESVQPVLLRLGRGFFYFLKQVIQIRS